MAAAMVETNRAQSLDPLQQRACWSQSHSNNNNSSSSSNSNSTTCNWVRFVNTLFAVLPCFVFACENGFVVHAIAFNTLVSGYGSGSDSGLCSALVERMTRHGKRNGKTTAMARHRWTRWTLHRLPFSYAFLSCVAPCRSLARLLACSTRRPALKRMCRDWNVCMYVCTNSEYTTTTTTCSIATLIR